MLFRVLHLSIAGILSTSDFPKNASCFEPFECLEQKAAYMTDRHIAAASIHIQSVRSVRARKADKPYNEVGLSDI